MKVFLKKNIAKYLKDDFIRNNIVFFIGSMVVAILNYLYHPVLGRLMSIEDFGEAQSLISLFMQFGIIGGVFNIIVINITANYDDKKERDAIISSLLKIAFFITGFVFLIIIIGSTFLQDFFQFSSFYPFISLAFLLLTGVSFTFRKAFMQGKENFKAVSFANMISAGGKLIFAACLVFIGWRSFGAITGLLISQLIALLYTYIKTKDDLKLCLFDKKNIGSILKSEYKYALLIFLSTSAITFLYTADVLMVKHWFSPEEAGLYSGIATIARIIFFATGSVSGVLLSAIKIKNSNQENKDILKKGIILTLFIAGSGFLIFTFFSELIIKILIGGRYIEFSGLLSSLSLLLMLVSVINLLFFYFLALRKTIIIHASIAGPLVIVLLSLFRHDSLKHIIYNFIIGSFVVLGVLFYGIFNKSKIGKS